MRIKSLAAALAASSLMLASTSAIAADASALSLSSSARAGAEQQDESKIMDSGLMGFLIIFGAGAVVGALLYSVIKGGDEDEPVSP